MKNLTPIARADRQPLPDFDAVPRKHRHDGWTPERQRAFIEAFADTGSVSRAAALIQAFDPVAMTLPEIEAMQAMLVDAAARHNATAAKDDPGPAYLSLGPKSDPYIGELEDEIGPIDRDFIPYNEEEPDWRDITAEHTPTPLPMGEGDSAPAERGEGRQ